MLQFFGLHYVALFYFAAFSLRWTRALRKPRHELGGRRLRRLERCSPMLLRRAEAHEQECRRLCANCICIIVGFVNHVCWPPRHVTERFHIGSYFVLHILRTARRILSIILSRCARDLCLHRGAICCNCGRAVSLASIRVQSDMFLRRRSRRGLLKILYLRLRVWLSVIGAIFGSPLARGGLQHRSRCDCPRSRVLLRVGAAHENAEWVSRRQRCFGMAARSLRRVYGVADVFELVREAGVWKSTASKCTNGRPCVCTGGAVCRGPLRRRRRVFDSFP